MYTAIQNHGIIPEIKIEKADDAVPLAKALSFAGIDIAEINFKTKTAERAIK
jgi:2-dehydro-3-deoxyphosphogluconate aldolase/(4S)-4-hydroxy-2-oxoglutarate aldolase